MNPLKQVSFLSRSGICGGGVSYAQTPTYISPTPRAGFSVHLLISNYEIQDISEGLEL